MEEASPSEEQRFLMKVPPYSFASAFRTRTGTEPDRGAAWSAVRRITAPARVLLACADQPPHGGGSIMRRIVVVGSVAAAVVNQLDANLKPIRTFIDRIGFQNGI